MSGRKTRAGHGVDLGRVSLLAAEQIAQAHRRHNVGVWNRSLLNDGLTPPQSSPTPSCFRHPLTRSWWLPSANSTMSHFRGDCVQSSRIASTMRTSGLIFPRAGARMGRVAVTRWLPFWVGCMASNLHSATDREDSQAAFLQSISLRNGQTASGFDHVSSPPRLHAASRIASTVRTSVLIFARAGADGAGAVAVLATRFRAIKGPTRRFGCRNSASSLRNWLMRSSPAPT